MRSSAANDLMGKGHVFKGSGPHFLKKGRARYNQLSNYCTTIAVVDGKTLITYRETVIVEFDATTITLRTGGWDTVTTRRKMNQASRQFELDFGVHRAKGQTYVTPFNGAALKFDVDTLHIQRVQP